MTNIIISGNVDKALLSRVYRLFTTPAGTVPFDRDFGIEFSCLDNVPAAVEGALLVEYTRKLLDYYPEVQIASLIFKYDENKVTPEVVIQYA